jgi:hypothetical protein
MRKLKEEERKMRVYKFNRQDRTCAPWAALCVLSLVAAMVFAAPSGVFAQTFELSQDCETAMVGTEHTITGTVTNGDVPVQGARLVFTVIGDNNPPISFSELTNKDGIVEITTYKRSYTGHDDITLMAPLLKPGPLATISTEWTAEDLCLTPHVEVGGKVTLNAKKRGALKKDFEVSNVEPESVLLAGVAPWRWKQKDSRLCLDGKDGVVDLVLKFKNREVLKALEKDLGKELVDGDDGVTLALTGELNDGTAFGGEWVAEFKKKGKRHGKNEQYQGHKNGKGKGPNK